MKLISIFLISFFAITGYSINSPGEQSLVKFQITKGFGKVTGHFKDVDYKINLNDEGSGSIVGTAKIASVQTKSSLRDKHLQNEEWFNAEKYPLMAIQSRKITKQTNGSYLGSFEIKIKGKSLIMQIPFEVLKNGHSKSLKANFNVSISAFDIGGGIVSYLVGDKVLVNLDLPF
jgi:polyisoprenoid-binding protein YceI